MAYRGGNDEQRSNVNALEKAGELNMSSSNISARWEKQPEPETREPRHFGPNGAVAGDGPGGTEARNVLYVLGNRDFTLFWSGQAISQIGTWMQQFAQGWVITTLAGSAFALASVNFAASIPMLILMPFGGVVADRMERRRILLVTQWVMALLAVLMGVLIHVGRLHLWHVWVVAFLLGLATAYDMPAYQSFYPQLVQPEALPQVIALNQASFHGSRIIGPALASWFVARWGMAAVFFANAASFLAVIGSLLTIKPRAAVAPGGMSKWRFMAEGMRYVRERKNIMALFGLTAITTIFVFPNVTVLMPFYVNHVLHVGTSGLAAIMAVSGAGALAGAMYLVVLPRSFRIRWIMVALVLVTLTLFALGLSRDLPLSIAAAAILSFGVASSLGVASVMVQENVPDAFRGRVMSFSGLAFTGAMPFAALAVARLADVTGMRRELLFAAGAYALCGMLLMPMLRRTNRGTHPDDE
jgi:MFS family permease